MLKILHEIEIEKTEIVIYPYRESIPVLAMNACTLIKKFNCTDKTRGPFVIIRTGALSSQLVDVLSMCILNFYGFCLRQASAD